MPGKQVQRLEGYGMQLDSMTCRQVLGSFCTGITVLTAELNGEPAGMTCQAFVSLSLDPPRVITCPGISSRSWPKIREAGTFCVNVLAGHQESLSRAFSRSSTDKFDGVQWSPGSTGAPRLDGALAWIECSIESSTVVGDHYVVVGRILDIQDGKGREPLLYFRGRYGTMTQAPDPLTCAAR